MDKSILNNISYGMYIVTAKDEKNVGCVINTLTQVTSDDPLISVCVNKQNYTNTVIRKTKKFAVSILSEKTNSNIISTFGFKSSKDIDKFNNLSYSLVDNIPVLDENTCGYIICELVEVIDANTHDIFIAKVIDTKKLHDYPPMTYKYYHEVIKGKAPKAAPTYTEETIDANDKEIWVCNICGYVHEGPLPDDFVCPICGVDVSNFKKKE